MPHLTTPPADATDPGDDRARAAVERGLADAHAAWTAGDPPRAMALLAELATRQPGAAIVFAQLGVYALQDFEERPPAGSAGA